MRIAVINDYKNLAREAADWSRLSSNHSVDFYTDFLPGGDPAAERLEPYDIIVAAREETLFDRALIERLPNLKLLISHATRNASFDMKALAERGITVCGTGYGYPNATVEITWGLILSLVKRIPKEDQGVRDGEWGLDLPLVLTGKTLGLLGLGLLGAGTAVVGKALQMNVIAWSQNLTEERCKEVGVRKVSKEEALSQGDVVCIKLVLSDRSRNLIGANELAMMKPTAFLVNTSRGPIVNEAALIDALRNRTIAGAGLDVYDTEPLPVDHPFRTLDNTLLSPHTGYVTQESIGAMYRNAVEDLVAFANGSTINVINK